MLDKTWEERFTKLRKDTYKALEQLIYDEGRCCKSYEGTFIWTVEYPSVFECEKNTCYYSLTLMCYVLGPGRKHKWSGNTPDEVIDKAEKDIYAWISDACC